MCRMGPAGAGGSLGEPCGPAVLGSGPNSATCWLSDLGRAARLSFGIRGAGIVMPPQGAVTEVEQNDVSAILEAPCPLPQSLP